MTDRNDAFNGLDLQEAIDVRWTLRDIRAKTLEIVLYQPIPLGQVEIDELDRDARR
jgi:hypothetical protein